MFLIRYLRSLNQGRFILWCYLIWYLVVLVRYFDSAPALWLTSLGLSFIIGIALYISSTASAGSPPMPFWPKFRLFLMPFCVSSFAALVKGKGFVLIFSPHWQDSALAVGLILIFFLLVRVAKKTAAR
ncbi:MAG: hypothetical protein ACO1QB_07890 [Verrucomicrobiales bacterium]